MKPTRKGTMRYIISFFFLLTLTHMIFANEILDLKNIPLSDSIKKSVESGEVFSESQVSSFDNAKKEKMQNLKFQIMGLHPRSCEIALKKLSLYENFKNSIDFVKESNYDDTTQELNFLLAHELLPYRMRLIFKLPRIKVPGTYPYSFEVGILKGLNGNIHVFEGKKRCYFYTDAHWFGPHTGFPNLIFEFFSQTLAKRSMEILFRISARLSN